MPVYLSSIRATFEGLRWALVNDERMQFRVVEEGKDPYRRKTAVYERPATDKRPAARIEARESYDETNIHLRIIVYL